MDYNNKSKEQLIRELHRLNTCLEKEKSKNNNSVQTNSYKSIKELSSEYELLYEVLKIGHNSDSLKSLCRNLLDYVLEVFPYECGGVYLIDKDLQVAELMCHKDFPADFAELEKSRNIDEYPYNKILPKGECVIADDYSEVTEKWGFVSIVCIPLISEDEVVGCLNVVSNKKQLLSDMKRNSLRIMGEEAGTIIAGMKAKEALQESEENYKNIYESSSEGILLTDIEGNILDANPALENILACPAEELRAKKHRDIIPVKWYGAFEKSIIELNNSGSLSIEMEYLDKSNLMIPVISNGWVVKYLAGRPLQYCFFIRDISKLKQAEVRLTKIQEFDKMILVSSPVAFILQDNDLRILRVSSSFEKITNRKIKDVIGKTPEEFLPNSTEKDVIIKRLGKVRDEGVVLDAVEYQGLSKKENYISERLIPIYNEKGQVSNILTILEDITKRRQAEENLKISEEKYRDIIELAPDPMVTIDNRGIITSCNDATYKLVGYHKEEILNKHFMKLAIIGLKDKKKYLKLFGDIILGKGLKKLEAIELYKKDKTPVQVEVNVTLVKEKGRIKGMQIVARDVTSRKNAEEQLKESGEKLRTIFQSANDIILFVDKTGKIIDVNDKIEDVLGFKKEDLVGKRFFELSVLEVGRIPEMLGIFYKIMKGRRLPTLYESIILGKDGKRHYVESSTKIVRKKGKIEGIVVVVRDVSYRKHAEKALRDNERRYRLLAENVLDVIWIVDIASMKPVYISPSVELLSGYKLDEIIKIPLDEMLVEESYRKIVRIFENEIETVKSDSKLVEGNLEFQLIRKDGSTVWTESKISIIPNEKNKKYSILGVTRDITSRKQIEEQLLQSSKMAAIGQLAGGVAHELNNPMAVIAGYVESLSEQVRESSMGDSGLNKNMSKLLERIDEQVYRCKYIIQNLVDFSRKAEYKYEGVDSNEVIEKVISLIEYKSKPEKKTIDKYLAYNLPLVRADKQQIIQAILNIVNNAIDAVESNGEINITNKKEGNSIVVEIKDNGNGIAKENIDKVFDPFFTTKPVGEGTGLGLSITYSIIKQMDGEISVKSKYGEGTSFILKLPVFSEVHEKGKNK